MGRREGKASLQLLILTSIPHYTVLLFPRARVFLCILGLWSQEDGALPFWTVISGEVKPELMVGLLPQCPFSASSVLASNLL